MIQSLSNKPESKKSWNNLHSGKQIKSVPAFSNCVGCVSNPSGVLSVKVAVQLHCRALDEPPLEPVDSESSELVMVSFSLELAVPPSVPSGLLGLVVVVAVFDNDQVVRCIVEFSAIDENWLVKECAVDGRSSLDESVATRSLRP